MFERDRPNAQAGKTPQTSVTTLSVLTSAFSDLGARQVLDVGCGDGTLAQMLHKQGFAVTGIDPSATAVARARRRLPMGEFHCATAENLPATLESFDAAYFVNSLHHVAPDQMQAAVLAALGAVRPCGIVMVIEPLPQGSFFRVMRPIEDETAIRNQASATLETLISSGKVILRDMRRWNRESHFSGPDDFIRYLARVAPERAEIAHANEAALARAWRDNIHSIGGMAVLIQPMICWSLVAPLELRR